MANVTEEKVENSKERGYNSISESMHCNTFHCCTGWFAARIYLAWLAERQWTE